MGALIPFAMAPAAAQTADSKASAWLGRDAGELLIQLRVDGGRVQIEEADGETHYTWTSINKAWNEQVVVASSSLFGLVPTTVVSQNIQHPEQHRCQITYVADREGKIRRYRYAGPMCRQDIVAPK
ncbi:hypothetical protein [Luteimonas sp. 100069]|uniref:hypothetical protein n=1 Tax=Luteimonas sp. 100069 TaxID=2006109 RepID=UPI000F4EEEA2|nr:hypothetical protein [Luteimonas sp. 100069]